MLEFITSTIVFELLKGIITSRRKRSNVRNIEIIADELPSCKNVGELRKLLKNFADDVPLEGGCGYPMLQPREVDGKGRLAIGSSNQYEPSVLLGAKA